jgi:hypothetical protein
MGANVHVTSSEAPSSVRVEYIWLMVAKQILFGEVSGEGRGELSTVDSQATEEKHAENTQLLVK